jgi:hypothetical protein
MKTTITDECLSVPKPTDEGIPWQKMKCTCMKQEEVVIRRLEIRFYENRTYHNPNPIHLASIKHDTCI